MSNLPPGVSVSDIPGNTAADQEYEAFWEYLIDHAPTDGLPENWAEDEAIGRLVDFVASVARKAGYEDGQHDAALAAFYEADQQ
mgnify:CR=1 FL=1